MIGRTALAGATALALFATSASAQQTQIYAYDVHGRLISVTRSTGISTEYAYDAADNRTYRATSGSTLAPFSLGGPVEAMSGTWATSNTITVSGVSSAVPVTITGGQYRIDGGIWQTATTTIASGQTIQVRAQAPATTGASRTASLNIDGVTSSFQVSAAGTQPLDTTPDPFDLGSAVSTAGSWAVSKAVTITGINTAAPVSISDGEYRINGGGWQSNAGSITAGQNIQVRLVAQPGLTSATLTIGSVSADFYAATLIIPDPDPGPGTGPRPCEPRPGLLCDL